MVKGITRQVILVKSLDPRLFEEAIFIVKEEALAREGVSADRVLKEARQAADGYLKQGRAWGAGPAGRRWTSTQCRPCHRPRSTGGGQVSPSPI